MKIRTNLPGQTFIPLIRISKEKLNPNINDYLIQKTVLEYLSK